MSYEISLISQKINNCDLDALRVLGSGTFGAMYHGKWRGVYVAIKNIHYIYFAEKSWIRERMKADFWNEMFILTNLHNLNIIAFYGIFYVGFGMEYLHDQNIILFCLKSDNLLVNLRDPNRPICKCSVLISCVSARGTIPWMASELMNGRRDLISEKALSVLPCAKNHLKIDEAEEAEKDMLSVKTCWVISMIVDMLAKEKYAEEATSESCLMATKASSQEGTSSSELESDKVFEVQLRKW
ncbi:hypothetical protein KFK09_011724 [Dendrobium nobile]|uniref:Protein kinase domain-containing protein n=1 Tax=Dendrobium nobile TaxID=94219 RepID=A0A8T3BDF8_DENNO|nr:hypothetical protein KFK09_011724 [Dendrobium nobile]